MRLLPLAAASLAFSLLAGCRSLTTNIDYDAEADFKGLERYAWIEEKEPEPSLQVKRVRKAVDAVLVERGYVLDEAQPDFFVSSYVSSKERVEVTDRGYTYSRWGGWYGGTYVDSYQYTEGNLVIDVVAAKDRTLIWRGTATKVVDESWTPQEIEQEIHTAAQALLEEFPPK